MSEIKSDSEDDVWDVGQALVSRKRTLTVQPYFWWTATEYACDVVSDPFIQPDKSEIDPSAQSDLHLLVGIRSTARHLDKQKQPVSAEQWQDTVRRAADKVKESARTATGYEIHLLPIVEQLPTNDEHPVSKNESWKNDMMSGRERSINLRGWLSSTDPKADFCIDYAFPCDLSAKKQAKISHRCGGEVAEEHLRKLRGPETRDDEASKAETLWWNSRVLGVARDLVMEEGPEDIKVSPCSEAQVQLMTARYTLKRKYT